MPREVLLRRRVVATAGGWAGDGANWTQGNPPAAATVQATEDTSPIMVLPISRREAKQFATRGAAGMMRVFGADPTRRFLMRIFVEWLRKEKDAQPISDWREITGAGGIDIGNGEDFTTDPVDVGDARIAFHLVPVGGNLGDASTVELWASEI